MMALDRDLLASILIANRSAGVMWSAGETSLLYLQPDERLLRLGYVPGPDELSLEDREAVSSSRLINRDEPIPTPPLWNFWDWRSCGAEVDGPGTYRNFVSPIKDQGNCGSCVAFGTAAAFDARMRTLKNLAINDPKGLSLTDVSEAQLFYCSLKDSHNCATGWWPSSALQYCQATGLAPEACFPYTPGDQKCNLSQGWEAMVTLVAETSVLGSIDDMERSLQSKGPLIAGFTVYEDFLSYKTGVYTYNGSAKRLGGHCICVVGYSDYRDYQGGHAYWICKNSWGPNWGSGGYFNIAFGQCGIDSQMWAIDSFSTIYQTPTTMDQKVTAAQFSSSG